MKQVEFLSRRMTTCWLAVLPLLYFYPAMLGRVLLAPGDGWAQNYPLRALLGEMLAHGEFPLWNPYIFAGMPLLATVYPGAAYPPNWLFAALPAGVAMNLVVITTYHLSLIGTYRFGRALGWRRNAALCTAITFTFSAFMLTHLGHTSRIAAAAWLPWVLLALERLARQVTWRWISIGIMVIGLQMLAGEPQMWLHTIMLTTAYVIWHLRHKYDRRLLLTSIAMLLGGVLLSAVQWLPALELVRYGGRAAMTYEAFTSFSLPPRQLAAFWLPYFAGGASTGPYRMPYVYWGEWQANVTCGYVGMLAWLLAVVASWRPAKSENDLSLRWVRFWLAVACISLLLAMGANLPGGVYRILFHLPGYNVFRGPYRHLLEFAFALSVLAGYGWQRLENASLLLRRKLLKHASVLISMVVFVACIAYVWLMPDLLPKADVVTKVTDANVTIPLACFAGSLIAAYWFWGIVLNPPRWISTTLLAWLIIDLAFYGHFFYWRDSPYAMQASAADTAVTRFIKAREATAHDYRLITQYRLSDKPDWSLNAELLNYPNTSLLRKLHSLNGYDVLRLARYERLIEQDAAGLAQADEVFSPAHRGLDLLNAKYVIYSNTLPAPASERWRKLDDFGPVSLYENLNVLPRAWLVPEARNLNSADVLSAIRTGALPDGTAFDPRQTVLFSRRALPDLPKGVTENSVHKPSIQIESYQANQITMSVATAESRWLVMSEIDFPGWEAWLNGQKATSYRADYVLRCLAIPAGNHRVEFHFRSQSFQLGLFLSLGTLFIVFLLSLWGWRHQRNRHS